MGSFQRSQVATLLRRLTEPPRRIVAVFGPRQTGKTTGIRQALLQIEQPSRYVAVDEPDVPALRPPPTPPSNDTALEPGVRNEQWLVRQWVDARREAERSPRGFVLVLDEIQRVPRWSETVKGLWDADRAAERAARRHPGVVTAAHAVGAEREPGRTLRADSLRALVVYGDGRRVRPRSATVPLLRRLSGGGVDASGSPAMAPVHPAGARRTQPGTRRPLDDARRHQDAGELDGAGHTV